jgi:hypothetical protein
MAKPRIFIGSSTEGLPVAEALCQQLADVAEPTLWTTEFFPGQLPA